MFRTIVRTRKMAAKFIQPESRYTLLLVNNFKFSKVSRLLAPG